MLRVRNPDHTRELLLDAAEREIHLHGFQGASLARLLAETGLTKGAFYHHFPSKQALGYAIVEERLNQMITGMWIEPLRQHTNPLLGMIAVIREASEQLGDELVRMGCPLNNLAQEMSPIDEGFRQRIARVYDRWHRSIVEGLLRGQGAGLVRTDIDCDAVARFIIASIEGALGMAKNAQNPAILVQCGVALSGYINSLQQA